MNEIHTEVLDKRKVLTLDSHSSSVCSTTGNRGHPQSNSTVTVRVDANPPSQHCSVMTSRSHQLHPHPAPGLHTIGTLSSGSHPSPENCEPIKNRVNKTDNLSSPRTARSRLVTNELPYHPATVAATPVTNANKFECASNSNLAMGKGVASLPIDCTVETKFHVPEYKYEPVVRQRPLRNASTFSATSVQVPTPSTLDSTGMNEAPRQFSRTCKTIFHGLVCASLYIVLFSSSRINLHVEKKDERFATHQNQPGIRDNNLREKRRSARKTLNTNQIPIPDFELENSSGDDSGDDSGDESPDNGGGAENPIVTGNRQVESLHSPMLGNGGNVERKKLRPSLAHATSLLSPQMQGAPKPKHDQDLIIYHYRDSTNDMTDARLGSHNLESHQDRQTQRINQRSTLAQAKSILDFGMDNILPASEQNGAPLFYDDRISKTNSNYKNAVILYGDKTNQFVLCLAWFFLVLFMMEAGAREMKRRYRLLRLSRFMDYSMQ